jgi:hypothetical protein
MLPLICDNDTKKPPGGGQFIVRGGDRDRTGVQTGYSKAFYMLIPRINCRDSAGPGRTNTFLSWMVLSKPHSLGLQQPFFFLSRRWHLVKDQPVRRPK